VNRKLYQRMIQFTVILSDPNPDFKVIILSNIKLLQKWYKIML